MSGDLRLQTACFTGHRELPIVGKQLLKNKLKSVLRNLIENSNIRFFGAGGALGFDTLAEQAVLELKKEYPDIRLILVLPCKTQADRWPERDKEIYEGILERADKVKYISEKYTKSCMFERNRHLVNNSSVCICFKTKGTGGTAYTMQYAHDKGLQIINLAE